jgi:hypothetical protein
VFPEENNVGVTVSIETEQVREIASFEEESPTRL